jgi:hypothetical protein
MSNVSPILKSVLHTERVGDTVKDTGRVSVIQAIAILLS